MKRIEGSFKCFTDLSPEARWFRLLGHGLWRVDYMGGVMSVV